MTIWLSQLMLNLNVPSHFRAMQLTCTLYVNTTISMIRTKHDQTEMLSSN